MTTDNETVEDVLREMRANGATAGYDYWASRIQAANAREVEALRLRADAAEADARRYRWIRKREVDVWRNKIISEERAERFDRDTDAAIASGGEG